MLASCTSSCSDTSVSHSSKYNACGEGQLSTPRAIPIAAGSHQAPGTLQDCPVTCAGRDGNTPKQPKSRVCATTRLEIPASPRAGGFSASPKKGTNGFHKEILLLHPPKKKKQSTNTNWEGGINKRATALTASFMQPKPEVVKGRNTSEARDKKLKKQICQMNY